MGETRKKVDISENDGVATMQNGLEVIFGSWETACFAVYALIHCL